MPLKAQHARSRMAPLLQALVTSPQPARTQVHTQIKWGPTCNPQSATPRSKLSPGHLGAAVRCTVEGRRLALLGARCSLEGRSHW